jgi:hypothetical protein
LTQPELGLSVLTVSWVDQRPDGGGHVAKNTVRNALSGDSRGLAV